MSAARGDAARADVRGADAIVLRRATLDDAPRIAAIEARSFGDPWAPSAFVSLARNGSAHFVVAVRADAVAEPLGYLVAWFVADEGEIANVAVAPEARGRGVGARLLDAALSEARRRGVVQCFLEVRESNATARALYASRGFREVGRRRRYYQHPVEDALVLRCALEPGGGAAS